MHRHLHKWHRRIGLLGALVAIYLSVTGLLLNHTHDLGLDSTHTRSPLLLDLYNVKPRIGLSVETGRHSVAQLGDNLFLDEKLIGEDASPLSGALMYHDMLLVASRKHLHLFLPDTGELIETLDQAAGLPSTIQRIGLTDDRVIVDDGTDFHVADPDISHWTPTTDASAAHFSRVRVLPPGRNEELSRIAPGAGPSWERILQDLHSGRLFGKLGSLVIDLTGVVILLLAVSGVVTLSLRRRLRKRSGSGRILPTE